MTDHENNLPSSFQQQILLDMMKQHISNGLSIQYPTDYGDQYLHHSSNEEDTSLVESNNEQNENENEEVPMAIVYKKRARIKFTQEQLDILEATFQEHRYPSVDIVDDLVEQLDLPTQKITVWFQNRRARLKKAQQKLEDQPSFEKDDPQPQQHYDSGIHLDEEVSHGSSTMPPSPPSSNTFLHLPPPPSAYLPSSVPTFVPSSSPYYWPNSHQSYYNTMWHNFRYSFSTPPFQSTMGPNAGGMPFNFANYGSSYSPPPPPPSSDYYSPFVFQDMTNYQNVQRQTEFHDEL